MICENCGKLIDDEVLFCPYCGEKKEVFEEEKVTKKESLLENCEVNNIIKILISINIIVLIISFLPLNIMLPCIGASSALVLFIINVLLFIKTKNKYNILLFILNFVLLLTNLNSIYLYSILK